MNIRKLVTHNRIPYGCGTSPYDIGHDHCYVFFYLFAIHLMIDKYSITVGFNTYKEDSYRRLFRYMR